MKIHVNLDVQLWRMRTWNSWCILVWYPYCFGRGFRSKAIPIIWAPRGQLRPTNLWTLSHREHPQLIGWLIGGGADRHIETRVLCAHRSTWNMMFEPANNRKKSDVSSGFSRLQRVYHKNKITLDPTFEVAAEAGAATQRLDRLPLSSAVFFCPTQFPIELSHMCSAAYRKRPGVCL